jgi:F0F1-type ATP synthase membrane subunit b/b'
MFELNGTLVIFVISFLGFMLALNELFLKPVGNVIALREGRIRKDLDTETNCREDAQELADTYERHLHEIHLEAQGLISHALEEAGATRSARLTRISQEGIKQLEEAKSTIAANRNQLITALVHEETELVQLITRKVLGDDTVQVSLDEAEVRRCLEETC